MSTIAAPIFNRKWEQRRKVQVRIPDPWEMIILRQMLQDPFPFFINIFDTAENFASIGTQTGVYSSSGIAALLSDEGRATLPEDWWMCGLFASFSAGAAGTAFSFQLQQTSGLGTENEATYAHQQSPIIGGNMCGTAQKPLWLKAPKLMPKNTELACTVQNLQSVANQIQVVLMGYLGEPAGGLT
jgi:hypothetical protein